MRRADRTGILLVCFVIALDQVTKWILDRALNLHQSVTVIPGFLNLTYVRNTGAAFGFLSSPEPGLRSTLLTVFSLIAIGAIIALWIKDREAGWVFVMGLAMVLGGAVGNLIDRVRLGEVVDFVDVYWRGYHWPAFNVADSAITVGVIFLLAHVVLQRPRPGR